MMLTNIITTLKSFIIPADNKQSDSFNNIGIRTLSDTGHEVAIIAFILAFLSFMLMLYYCCRHLLLDSHRRYIEQINNVVVEPNHSYESTAIRDSQTSTSEPAPVPVRALTTPTAVENNFAVSSSQSPVTNTSRSNNIQPLRNTLN